MISDTRLDGKRGQVRVVIPVTHDRAGNLVSGIDGEIAVRSLDEMEARLQFATNEQAASLFERLGVEHEVAREGAQNSQGTRDLWLEAEPANEKTEPSSREWAVLLLPSTVQGNASVSLLSRVNRSRMSLGSQQGAWHGVDHLLLNSFAHAVSCEWVSLPGMAEPLLAVHHVNTGHGSNEDEDETEVYAIHKDKLVRRMHTQDYSSKPYWARSATHRDQSQVMERRSTFLPFPDGSIEETQATVLDGRPSGVRRRYWRWRAAAGEFVASDFSPAHAR